LHNCFAISYFFYQNYDNLEKYFFENGVKSEMSGEFDFAEISK